MKIFTAIRMLGDRVSEGQHATMTRSMYTTCATVIRLHIVGDGGIGPFNTHPGFAAGLDTIITTWS